MKNIDKKRGTQIEISRYSSFPGMLKYLEAKRNTCRLPLKKCVLKRKKHSSVVFSVESSFAAAKLSLINL